MELNAAYGDPLEVSMVNVLPDVLDTLNGFSSPSCHKKAFQIKGLDNTKSFYSHLYLFYSKFNYYVKDMEKVLMLDGIIVKGDYQMTDLSDFKKKLDVVWRTGSDSGKLTNISHTELKIFTTLLSIKSTDVVVRIEPQSLKGGKHENPTNK